MKKTTPKKETSIPLCFNCDGTMTEPELFCSKLCNQEAALVRRWRNYREQGRLDDPDIRYGLEQERRMVLGGGYPGRERNPKIREEVIARAKGLCEICGKPGTQIDHVRGRSKDLSNMQYLCEQCHQKKTVHNLRPIPPDDPRRDELKKKWAGLFVRIKADEPLRPCDNHRTWEKDWPIYKSEREAILGGNLSFGFGPSITCSQRNISKRFLAPPKRYRTDA